MTNTHGCMAGLNSMDMKIVVFDLGGVVVRICRSWQEACATAGEPFHAPVATPEFIARRKPFSHAFEIGEINDREFYRAVARTTDGLYTPEQFERIHSAWILDEYAGVARLIDDLHARGISTGVLSNTNAAHWLQLADHPHIAGHRAKFPTPGKVRHLHASHLMGLAKPDTQIYRRFCDVTGYRPGEILFFDDLEENVQAARAAGWAANRIDHTGDTAAQMRAVLSLLDI